MDKHKSTHKIVLAFLVLQVIFFSGFFLYSLLTYTAGKALPAFAAEWQLYSALNLHFWYLPAILFLCFAISVGTCTGPSRLLGQSALLPAVVLSSLLSVFVILASPAVARAMNNLENRTRLFTESLQASRRNLDAGDIPASREQFSISQAISQNDKRLLEFESRLRAAEIKSIRSIATKEKSPLLPTMVNPEAAQSFYLAAKDMYDKGNYQSANWNASVAAALDPAYSEAKRLAAQSWVKLNEKPGVDTQQIELYNQKLHAYTRLQVKDSITAYKLFLELSEKYPYDKDIIRYLAESKAELAKISFDKKDADRVLSGPFVISTFFLRISNTNTKSNFNKDIILVSKDAALSSNRLYFRELEYYEIGVPPVSVKSPYALFHDNTLFLTSIDKKDFSFVSFQPTWLSGPFTEQSNVLSLALSAEKAYLSASAHNNPTTLPIWQLFSAINLANDFGLDRKPLLYDIAKRSAIPFVLFTSAILGAFAGARFRSKQRRFKPALLLLVPIMALAIVPIFFVTSQLSDLISLWVVKLSPNYSSLVIASGFRSLLLLVSVLLIFGLSDSEEFNQAV